MGSAGAYGLAQLATRLLVNEGKNGAGLTEAQPPIRLLRHYPPRTDIAIQYVTHCNVLAKLKALAPSLPTMTPWRELSQPGASRARRKGEKSAPSISL